MDGLRDILVWACLVGGGLFSVIGGIGLLRMPDFYTRTHAASLTDTMGATLILLGLAIHNGIDLVTVKLVIIFLFLFLTSPTAAHALVKAAYSKGLEAPDVQEATGAAEAIRNEALEAARRGEGT
ncbi:MAG: monovalent cation/H(+) antiporter subunit G [bacterium]|nr:monovalent cation/H(+) antiporter subunit G [bacterium]